MPNAKLRTIGLAAIAGLCAIPQAAAANPSTTAYYQSFSAEPNVPALLSDKDKAYYAQVFAAIAREDWDAVEQLLAQGDNSALHKLVMAEYFLDANSPTIPLDRLNDWLARSGELPQAEQIGRLAIRRGADQMPDLPATRRLSSTGYSPKRIKPRPASDGSMPSDVEARIRDAITNDDPSGAHALLNEIDPQLGSEARAEWRQRVAWSYYIENRDAEALALARTVEDGGSGAWIAEGWWVAGLASWRLGDCATSADAFQRSSYWSQNEELTAAALYWQARSDIRCRQPDKAQGLLRDAARRDETLYGMIAAAALGTQLPDPHRGPDFSSDDWKDLSGLQNVQLAVKLVELGEDARADEVLRYQAKIGDPREHRALTRLARELGLPQTQLWMAYNAPSGGNYEPAARYPTVRWQPVGGWRVDPALAFAHALQESIFRTSVVSPANAKGLMQITPITVRQHAGSLGMNPGAVDLTDPRVNLAFGQRNLEMLRDTPATRDNLLKIMAAYNAGLTPITRWNTEIRDQDDPLLYMESIPYWETRGYVAIVLKNYWMYERQAGSTSESRMALANGEWPSFPTASADDRMASSRR
ncbi:lytic transglycosylase domain-containing protein [Pseudoblastomonas halimionae]|uniref:Transglycosylase SLT domain-containing protein n=1 Tax=Alteriqipengyuania halimionae TaxID=1926630 RepID=A0A6I4U2U3_9SPHN|nr:lytic transglycosylase domain-containing protein [Alteriqipengyuania halimionae]MXP09273.1 transglycosylase SLT domain-containing protein [Alteriqipengyuania halimionae]